MSATRICNLWNNMFKAPDFAEIRDNNVPVRMKETARVLATTAPHH